MEDSQGKVRKGWQSDFFQVPNEIYDSKLSGHAKAVYVYLCRRADSEGQSFPGYGRIANEIGFSKSTVRRAIGELIQTGILVKEFRGRKPNKEFKSNLYTVLHPSVSSENIPSVSENMPSVPEDRPMSPKTTEVDQLSRPINQTYPNINKHDKVVDVQVDPVVGKIENVLGRALRGAEQKDIARWINQYTADQLLGWAAYAREHATGNVFGYFRRAVENAYDIVPAMEDKPAYDVRYHNYYMTTERDRYIPYCCANPTYQTQLVAAYGPAVLTTMEVTSDASR